jgi:hypothetical protein
MPQGQICQKAPSPPKRRRCPFTTIQFAKLVHSCEKYKPFLFNIDKKKGKNA